MMGDSTRRFSGREEVYSKYRPRYPADILKLLKSVTRLNQTDIVADIGSGTGILAELFLKNGNTVYGVEPNDDMRRMAERYLSAHSKFISVKGSAENTTLPGESIDIITVGQALHWFDIPRTRKEFSRVLRKNGYVCVVYNERSSSDSFTAEYGEIVKSHATKEIPLNEYVPPDELFGSSYNSYNIANEQKLDLDGLVGRAVSASYSPDYDDDRFPALERDLKALFEKWQNNGSVTLSYNTRLFFGSITI
ncbi:MAG: methyltransferase domain-containing protein [Nitrososphaerota archaeon]|nr:methyltransferase domain-containing protein [Nitrososphaerota archaeon]